MNTLGHDGGQEILKKFWPKPHRMGQPAPSKWAAFTPPRTWADVPMSDLATRQLEEDLAHFLQSEPLTEQKRLTLQAALAIVQESAAGKLVEEDEKR